MTTTAILSLLSLAASPMLTSLLAARRTQEASQRLLMDLSLARAEAVKRNRPVLVCAKGGPSSTTCGTVTSQWTVGWTLCAAAADADSCLDSTSTNPNPFRIQNGLTGPVTVTGPEESMRFMPDGTLRMKSYTSLRVSDSALKGGEWTIRISPSGAMSARKE